jgi:hypothetical protein
MNWLSCRVRRGRGSHQDLRNKWGDFPRILGPLARTSGGLDWEYAWYNGDWWKVQPSVGAKMRDISRGDWKISSNLSGWEITVCSIPDKQYVYSFDGKTHHSVVFKQIYRVKPTDSEWYPGKQAGKIPWNVIIDYGCGYRASGGSRQQLVADLQGLLSVTPWGEAGQ